jgi:hypothetical protein
LNYSKVIENIKIFSIGASFMMVFGIIDNLGLFMGMSVVEEWIMKKGFDSQVAAGIGNTFSDMLGVMLGGVVSAALYKLLKVKKEETTFWQKLVGVFIGCLLPVIVKVVILSI